MQDAVWIFGLIAVAIWGLTSSIGPPAKMVVIAFWIFFAVKFQSLRTLRNRTAKRATVWTAMQWYLLTPTLDANQFFHISLPVSDHPTAREWAFAIVKTLAGAVLFFIVAGEFVGNNVMTGGWIAMIGIVLMLHFGVLELIVLWWRFRGRDVRPLMQQPLQASSLSDFWGRRWNTGFRDFAHEQIFRPLCRRWNARIATLGSFIFSGLIHELAISVPAGGGYGLPFTYFVIQWLGVTLERVASQRGWPVRSGIFGWLFAAGFLLAPAGFLFHAAFVQNVIVPLIPKIQMLH